MKMYFRKLGDTVVALAALVAPVVAGSCRAYFHEEKEPLGLQEFARKKQSNRKRKNQ